MELGSSLVYTAVVSSQNDCGIKTPALLSGYIDYDHMANTSFASYGKISLMNWGEQGFFVKNWHNYDQLVRSSFHTVTAQCRIPAKVLQSLDFTRLKLLDGQPMIANKLTYELTDDPVVDVEIELKTAKIYE